MLEIIPAIDILKGKVVRLFQGKYDKVTEYETTPMAQAKKFQKAGVRRIHVVDLDGAKDGSTTNFSLVKDIRKNSDVEIEVGGGIRTEDDIKRYLDAGVNYVILGTKAVTDKAFLEEMLSKYSKKIIVGLDTKEGRPAVSGWVDTVLGTTEEFIKEYEALGVKEIIHTDIKTDGALVGVDIEALKKTLSYSNIPFVLSGGVSSIEDIKALKTLNDDKLKGVIVGRAIYDGRLDLNEAVQILKKG